MYSFILGILRNRQAADDAFQETFVKIIRGAAGFQPDRKFSSWAFKIANNVCVDMMRKDLRREINIEYDDAAVDNSPGPDSAYEEKEQAQRLRDHIASLPDAQRRVVILREFAGLSFKEIADILDCPLNTALGRMRDALRKLRPMLESGQNG